ncbi:MAG: primosomal protein N', partial [Cytophagales bacterium]|nr:primosomal protein N' [Cytophagales bacterium]
MRKECLTSFFAAKMKERETFFADILLPLYLKGCFTYRIPVDLHTLLKPGFRVVVPFGNSKVQTGIVTRIHSNVPEFSVKYILEVLDEQPVVTDAQLKLFKWTAAYYMCTEGEVLNAALPSGLKISSESRIQIHPFFSLEDENSLTDHERHLLEALKEKEYLNYKEVGEILKIKSFVQVVRSLVQKEAVILFESVKDKFKPKRVKRIRFTPAFADEERNLEELFQSLEKKEKQL